MANEKIERKYLVHYLDASFGGESVNYVRLGKDLEDYSEELNPDIETSKNIWGESNVNHNGYEPQSEVDTFYAREGDPLYEKLETIANERLTGDACKTTKVDVLLKAGGTCVWAYREEVYVIPTKTGGDTSGYQIPYEIYNAGSRVKGTWASATKTFTESAASTASAG